MLFVPVLPFEYVTSKEVSGRADEQALFDEWLQHRTVVSFAVTQTPMKPADSTGMAGLPSIIEHQCDLSTSR
jgi:hypothetical protein